MFGLLSHYRLELAAKLVQYRLDESDDCLVFDKCQVTEQDFDN